MLKSTVHAFANEARFRGLTKTAIFLYDKLSAHESSDPDANYLGPEPSSEASQPPSQRTITSSIDYDLAKGYFDNEEFERCCFVLERYFENQYS